MTQSAQSSGHEWVPDEIMKCCSCGESCHTPTSLMDYAREECKKWHAAHVAFVAQAAQPASAAKPAEDGLEAQLMDFLVEQQATLFLAKPIAAFIRTHQAAQLEKAFSDGAAQHEAVWGAALRKRIEEQAARERELRERVRIAESIIECIGLFLKMERPLSLPDVAKKIESLTKTPGQ